jgi:hypothetical protein
MPTIDSAASIHVAGPELVLASTGARRLSMHGAGPCDCLADRGERSVVAQPKRPDRGYVAVSGVCQRALLPACGVGFRTALGDEGPAAPPRGEHACGFKLGIGASDSTRRKAKVAGQLPDRSKPTARPEFARLDQPGDLRPELLVRRHRPGEVDSQNGRRRCRPAG